MVLPHLPIISCIAIILMKLKLLVVEIIVLRSFAPFRFVRARYLAKLRKLYKIFFVLILPGLCYSSFSKCLFLCLSTVASSANCNKLIWLNGMSFPLTYQHPSCRYFSYFYALNESIESLSKRIQA